MAFPILPAMDESLLVWAQYYAAHGWPVFPCSGKIPLTPNGFKDATTDGFQLAAWWTQAPEANIGIPTGLHFWALDIDPRAGGDDTLRQLEQQFGALPRTLLSHTGGGGNHQCWALPTGRTVQNKARLGDGLDVQALGSYIIVPPSRHPDTNRQYIWDLIDGPDDQLPQDAPEWLLRLVCPPTTPGTALPAPPLPAAYEPIYEGHRNQTLMQIGARLAHSGLTEDVIVSTLLVINQLRCQPPLPDDDVHQVARSVTRYQRPTFSVPVAAPAAPGWPSPSPNGGPGTSPPPFASSQSMWRGLLHSKKSGGLVQDAQNMTLILAQHAFFQGKLWWDEVRAQPMFDTEVIDDDTIVSMAAWLGTEEGMSITNLRLLERCVLSQCRTQRIDRIQGWLQQLPAWDGQPRLNSWLHDYAGVAPTAYGQDVARLLLVSMVARALEPGCICRYVVILEGPENWGKSELVKALGQEWYTILTLNLDSKDSHIMLQGAWIAEFAELDSMSKTEETRLKAFITMREDSYVPKFSNFRSSYARRTVFVGTTNEMSYLKGRTGNTRYLPVRLTTPVDLAGFQAVREQLFAEALSVYHNGLPWWLMSPDGTTQAVDEREERRVTNVYEAGLAQWFDDERPYLAVYNGATRVTFDPNQTSWPEIARWFLRIEKPADWKDRSLQMQIADALKTLGWERKRARIGHKVSWVWVKK